MSSKNRIYDDKTVVVNYLMTHYAEDGARTEMRRRTRIIKDAADEIFQLRFFPKSLESAAWHKPQVIKILERMERKLEQAEDDLSTKPPATPVA